jgi:hypothetical protein
MLKMDEMADSGPISQAWRDTIGEIEIRTKVLWRYIRGERQGERFIPVFSQGAESILRDIEEAEARLADTEVDSEMFVDLMGQYRSLTELITALHREQHKIDNAEYNCRAILEREMRNHHNMLVEEVRELDVVKDAYLARDRVVAEVEPKVQDLQNRMQKAKIILSKYN